MTGTEVSVYPWMKMLNKEDVMFQQLTVSMKFFQLFLSEQFLKHRTEGIEALLMLVVGNLMGFYNPNQLADYLGLDKNALYRELRGWSLLLAQAHAHLSRLSLCAFPDKRNPTKKCINSIEKPNHYKCR